MLTGSGNRRAVPRGVGRQSVGQRRSGSGHDDDTAHEGRNVTRRAIVAAAVAAAITAGLTGCGAPDPTSSVWLPRPVTATPAADPTLRVERVIDGDTLVVTGGQRVRLAGVDTPERGRCGADRATARTAALTRGQTVRLIPAGLTRVDRYGRTIAYVEAGGVDVGMELLRDGLARARYDSRDGYGLHPRQTAYIGADRGSRVACGR